MRPLSGPRPQALARGGLRRRRARRLGLISDTHDRLRPEAVAALRRCDLILHAGDVCRPDLLSELEKIAPVLAVRGNNDRGAWARRLPRTRTVEVEGHRILVIHDLKEMKRSARRPAADIIVSGHSHRPRIDWAEEVLYVNPGSAGPRRFSLPVTLARISFGARGPNARIIELVPSPTTSAPVTVR
jgi:putative phosphoesterase